MTYDVADVAARFQENGFALVEEFLCPEEADQLNRELDRYVKEVVPRVSTGVMCFTNQMPVDRSARRATSRGTTTISRRLPTAPTCSNWWRRV